MCIPKMSVRIIEYEDPITQISFSELKRGGLKPSRDLQRLVFRNRIDVRPNLASASRLM